MEGFTPKLNEEEATEACDVDCTPNEKPDEDDVAVLDDAAIPNENEDALEEAIEVEAELGAGAAPGLVA